MLESVHLRQVNSLGLEEIRRVSAKTTAGFTGDVVRVGPGRGARHGAVARHAGEKRARVPEAAHLRDVVRGGVVREGHAELRPVARLAALEHGDILDGRSVLRDAHLILGDARGARHALHDLVRRLGGARRRD